MHSDKKTISNSSIEKWLNQIDKKYYWIMAGFLAALFVYLGFSFAGMLSGGLYVIERGDLLESHVSYIRMMCRHIMNGESIWYSFDVSMGMNTALVLAYDTFSPFNVLFIIFNKSDDNLIVTIIILLKIFLASSFFQLFSRRVLKVEGLFSIIFSICYSLCGFSIAYGTYHIMYLDGLYILPLLCLLIVLAIEEKKYIALSLCYAYLFISEFYIGYMVGIFSMIFFVAYLINSYKQRKIKDNLRIVLCWLASVSIAIILSAIMWVPTLCFLLNEYVPYSTEFVGSPGITILELFDSLFWGQYIDNFDRHSYSYCGLLVLLIVPFYFTNKNIPRREKIISCVVLFFLTSCFIFKPFYMLIHAFDTPDYYWFRFSFLFSFFLCFLASRQSLYWKDISIRKMLVYVVGFLFLYAIEERLEKRGLLSMANNSNNFFWNSCFIFGWAFLLTVLQKVGRKRFLATSLLLVFLLGIEEVSNMYYFMDGKTFASEYYNWDSAIKTGLQTISEIELNDKEFYRVIIDNDLIHDSDSLYGYNGVSDFGTAENYNLRKTMSNLGFGTSPRLTLASGFNPASNMILGIKYVVKINVLRGDVYTDNIYPYKESLHLGYMVEDGMLDYKFPSRNVFVNINDVLNKMTGLDEECFTRIDDERIECNYNSAAIYRNDETSECVIEISKPNGSIDFNIPNDNYEDVYMQLQLDDPKSYVDFYWISGVNVVNGSDYSVGLSDSIQLFYNQDQNVYYTTMSASDDSLESIKVDDINFYEYHSEALKKNYEQLYKEQLIVEEYKAGYVKGHISVSGDRRILMTTIPYDKGWSVWLNGNKVDCFATMGDAFMAIRLPDKGEYDIEMKYEPPGVKTGIYITLFGFILLAFWGSFDYIKKKKMQMISANEKDEINIIGA